MKKVGPYRKPTQVGRERILRCLSEMRLRNSANCHRKFAIRWASMVKSLRMELNLVAEKRG